MPGSSAGSTKGHLELQQFLTKGPAPIEVNVHLDPKYTQGGTGGWVHIVQFWPKGPAGSSYGFHADAKYSQGSTKGWIHLPIEGGGETIIVATWEDDIVAQLALRDIPTTRTTVYTVPVSPARNAIIRFIDLINDTGSAITVDLWIDGVKIVPSWSLPANDIKSRNGIWDIGPGDIIEAQASGAGANLSISGVLEVAA